jgi:N-acetylneuraminic acid mutarotase
MRTRIATISAVLALAGALVSFGSTASATPSASRGAWSGTGPANVSRSSQTATRLFGGKVLVVGGVRAGQALASAELYHPGSGTWTTTTPLAVARFLHTATLLPDGRIVVVGGTGAAGQPVASTEIYDPQAGTWSSTGDLLTARSSHTATLLSSGLILVVGGIGPDGQPLASAELYSPAKGTWSATGYMATARSGQSATLLADGKVLVAGGTGVDGKPLASAELYNPTAGSWSATGSMAAARSAHTATDLGDEISGGAGRRVLVAGGIGSDGSRLASAELYDQSSGVWRNTGALTVGRSSHTATLLPNGSVLVAGGTGPGASPSASAELYDPATGHWRLTGALAGARTAHTATVLLSGRVLVAGGAGAGGASLSSAELYEPDLGVRWEPTGSLSAARSGHTATLLPDGDVLVAGGQSTTTSVTPPRMIDPLASAELYHPRSGTWSVTGSLGQARSFQTATLLQGSPAQCGNNCGKVLVAGGIGADPTGRAQTIASAELYDPRTGRWSATGSMTTPRALHTATLLPSGKVLVVAGAGPGGAEPRNANQLASAELYDPVTGTWTATGSLTGTTSPPASNTPLGARLGQSAILLDKGNCGSNCGKVLVVGGVGGVGAGPALASAELYDPRTGTFRATASLDQSRQGQAAVLLANGKVLVIGGFHDPFGTTAPNLSSGEIYNPATETWSPSGSLAARRIGATATLMDNGQVIVTGGAGGGNAPGTTNEAGPALFSTESFNANDNVWSRTSFLNIARVYHTATLLPSGPSSVCGQNCGKVLVAGGDAELIGNFPPYFNLLSPLRSAELYTPAAVIKALRIHPSAFLAARSGPSATRAAARHKRGQGARVSYTLNVAARVRFTVYRLAGGRRVGRRCVALRKSNQRRRRCTRTVPVRGSFKVRGEAGRNSFRFTGRLNRKRLAPRVYQLLAMPSVDGRTSATVRGTFRIRA